MFEDFRELSISFRYKLNSRFLENFANFFIILVTSSKKSVLSLLSEKYLYDLDPESPKRIRAFYLDQPEGDKQLRNDAEILNILKDVFSMAFFIQPMVKGCVSRDI